MTIDEALREGAAQLRAADIDNPRLEARLLLAYALHATNEDVLRDRNASIDAACFHSLLARRIAREPLAHILGRREFWSLDLLVSSDTLVPRPETETLIEAALAAFAGQPPPCHVLDLGTGSGCLLLAALSEFPASFGIGIDRSPPALTVARRNAARLGLKDRTAFLCSDWAAAIGSRFDLVLSNPPYIPSLEIVGLMPEVARCEPRLALDGGPDGCAAYRCLIPDLDRLLTTRGVAVLEMGEGQADAVSALGREAGFAAATRQDLTGIARAIVLNR
jgi:release factor glutamine methyltransferase